MTKYQVTVEQLYQGAYETIVHTGCIDLMVHGEFFEVKVEGKPRISSELVPEELVSRKVLCYLYFRPIRVEILEEE